MQTRCPECQTVFRVTPEQLKARAGNVRCGHCQTAFNALDSLLEALPTAPLSAQDQATTPAALDSPRAQRRAAAAARYAALQTRRTLGPRAAVPNPAPPAKPDSPTKPTANQYAQASQGAGRAPSNQTLAVDDLDDDIPF